MKKPKISIIIPVYDVEKYLERCLNSVLIQTFQDWEAICVNDGSPDNSAAILEEFAKKDSRFKIITQENQSLSVARNNGLKEAQGEYISFLDSDDAMHPQLLNIAYSAAQNNNADWVCFGYEKSDGIKYAPKYITENSIKYSEITDPVFINKKKNKISFNVWSKLYKKELIDGINFVPDIHFQDYPFTYAVMSRKPKTILIDADLIYYSINYDSISHKKSNPKQIRDYHKGIKFIYDTYNDKSFAKEISFIKRYLMPKILKRQLTLCNKANLDTKTLMLKEFANELRDLQNKGLISIKGHKLNRYLAYKKIMKKY